MEIEKLLKSQQAYSLEKKLVLNLMMTTTKASTKMADTAKRFDISIQQFNVLRILRGQNGKPANLNTIQNRMVHKMSNTTRLVDKLLEKKLVDRCICEKNRRKVEIIITKKGLNLLTKMDSEVEKNEASICEGLNHAEKLQLNELLEKLRSNI